MAKVFQKLKHHRCHLTVLMSSSLCLYFYFQNSVLTYEPESYARTRGACVSDPGHSLWFRTRYEPSVHLLLNSSNRVLPADVLRWWKDLQNVTRVANYTEVVDQMFSLFPDKDHYSDTGPDRCRLCAVVGNSGNLLQSNYGLNIDSHDFVMRLNKGPIEGYEKDVGSRTTHRFMYPESAVDVDNSTHLVFTPFKILDMEWLISAFTTKNITKTYMKVPSTIKANKDKVMILHPEFIKYVHVNWTENHGRYPSTGFLTVIFALHICDKVNVFGFGATNDGNWHHYFDETLTPYSNESHAGDYEYKIINQMQKEKKIFMYKGSTGTVARISSTMSPNTGSVIIDEKYQNSG